MSKHPATRTWTVSQSPSDEGVIEVSAFDGDDIGRVDVDYITDALNEAAARYGAFQQSSSPQGAVGPAFREAQSLGTD